MLRSPLFWICVSVFVFVFYGIFGLIFVLLVIICAYGKGWAGRPSLF